MKHWLWGMACLLSCSMSYAADITGVWRTIDDKTGFSKALIQIEKQPDGTYNGTIIKIIPRPNYTPKELCQNCPAPYTNQPILGLTILKGLKADPLKPNHYTSARVLDPLSGRLYKGKAKVNADNRQLSMRGYVGISAMGRSQIWIREH